MPDILQSSEKLLQIFAVVAIEFLTLSLIVSVVVWVVKRVYKNLLQRTHVEKIQQSLNNAWRLFKVFMVVLFSILTAGIVGTNSWLVWKGKEPMKTTLEWINAIPQDFWLQLAIILMQIIVMAIAAVVLVKYTRKALIIAEKKLSTFSHLKEDNSQLIRFFSSLTQVLTTSTWLFFAVFVIHQLLLPEFIQTLLLKLVTIYLIVGISLIIARMVAMVVTTLQALSASYAQDKSWFNYYDALEPLVPLLRKSLEYIVWITSITLVIAQLNPIAEFSKYGPRLIQSIGIFFIARVFIDAGFLVIENEQNADDADEMTQRRRATILPLMKSLFKYATYFITFVLILGTLGIDIMPFLAGAGILGVVIGFGAQPFINDIVSGFFILFENIFLLDDVIEVGGVLGRVESIDFRTTKIRDPDGNLHVIRNGDLNHVKNYSKDFTFAVVEVRIGYDVDMKDVRAVLENCGEQIKQQLPEFVTGDMVVAGIVEFEKSAMRIRTTTPVTPAKHFVVATQLREIIKVAFDDKGWVMPAAKHQVELISKDILG